MTPQAFKKLFKTKRQKKIGSDPLLDVAFHESGHKLFDKLIGYDYSKITMIPDYQAGTKGSVDNFWILEGYYDIADYNLQNEIEMTREGELEFLITRLMGGIIGESFYSGKYNWIGAYGDLHDIKEYLISYGDIDMPDLQYYWDKTFDVVKSNFESLNQMANELYAKQASTANKVMEKHLLNEEYIQEEEVDENELLSIKHRCFKALTSITDIESKQQLEWYAKIYYVTVEDVLKYSMEYYQLKGEKE